MWNGNRMRSLCNSVILSVMLVAPLSASVLLSFQPSSAVASNGSPLAVDVVISGLGLPPEVGSFDVFVGYNPALLSPVDVTFGLLLGDPLLFEALTASDISSVPGVVEGAEVSLLTTTDLDLRQSASFTLFTVDFMGIGNGAVAFKYLGGPVDDGNGVLIYGTKTVIPEVHSSLLVGSALTLFCLGRLAKGQLPHLRVR